MSQIDRDEVNRIARLARLYLDPAEQDAFTRQLNSVLEHMDKLRALDTDEVQPTYHVLPLVNVFRADEVVPGLTQEEALANAPDPAGGGFRVPKIVEA